MYSLISHIKFWFCPSKELVKSLRSILGFYPNNIKYYELAFIHKSASIIEGNGVALNNERLEYLGDAILDAVISDYLYHAFDKYPEGFLTQMRSKIVNGEKLNELATKIGITKHINSNITHSKKIKNIYGNTLEAFVGAIYIDRGYKIVSKFIIEKLIKNNIDIKQLEHINENYKSQLIEWGQKYKRNIKFITDLKAPNSKVFVSNVMIDNEFYGDGLGNSKKEAEQNAAQSALDAINKYIVNA